MNYLLYSIFFLLFYILQTTLFSGWLLRPELILILFCLFFSGRSYKAMAAGFLTGAVLDILNGYSFYNTVLYTLTGTLCGFIPVSIFRHFQSLVLVNLLLSSVLQYLGYALLSRIFLGKFITLNIPAYLLILILDVVCFFLIYWIFHRSRNE